MRRVLAAAPMLAAIALLATGCGSSDPRNAAVVNGDAITVDQLNRELDALVGNEALQAALQQQGAVESVSEREGTASLELASGWLSRLVQSVLVEQELDRRGEKVTDEQRKQAVDDAPDRYGPEVFATFSKSFRDRLIERDARVIALTESSQDTSPPSEADLQALFDEHRGEIPAEILCVSHILVPTRSQADALKAQLDQGADFGKLAQANSIDTGSAPGGGKLGCTDLATDSYVPEFQAAAETAPVGEVSDPVETEYGFHLLLVTTRGAPTVDAFHDELVALYEQQRGDPEQALAKLARGADISVNPRYGTVVSDPSFFIEPPAPTKLRVGSDPTTTTTPTTLPIIPGG